MTHSFSVKTGVTGDCTWTLAGTLLTISGNGSMENYTTSNDAPWGASVTEIIIEEGVTSIGSFAFRDCTGLTSVTIPDSVTSIGDDAFLDYHLVEELDEDGDTENCDAYQLGICIGKCDGCKDHSNFIPRSH